MKTGDDRLKDLEDSVVHFDIAAHVTTAGDYSADDISVGIVSRSPVNHYRKLLGTMPHSCYICLKRAPTMLTVAVAATPVVSLIVQR
ncbi:unnamed protein product, partial [Iphiclides podalirius]